MPSLQLRISSGGPGLNVPRDLSSQSVSELSTDEIRVYQLARTATDDVSAAQAFKSSVKGDSKDQLLVKRQVGAHTFYYILEADSLTIEKSKTIIRLENGVELTVVEFIDDESELFENPFGSEQDTPNPVLLGHAKRLLGMTNGLREPTAYVGLRPRTNQRPARSSLVRSEIFADNQAKPAYIEATRTGFIHSRNGEVGADGLAYGGYSVVFENGAEFSGEFSAGIRNGMGVLKIGNTELTGDFKGDSVSDATIILTDPDLGNFVATEVAMGADGSDLRCRVTKEYYVFSIEAELALDSRSNDTHLTSVVIHPAEGSPVEIADGQRWGMDQGAAFWVETADNQVAVYSHGGAIYNGEVSNLGTDEATIPDGGETTWPDGTRFVGEYYRLSPVQGTLYRTDGSRFEGEVIRSTPWSGKLFVPDSRGSETVYLVSDGEAPRIIAGSGTREYRNFEIEGMWENSRLVADQDKVVRRNRDARNGRTRYTIEGAVAGSKWNGRVVVRGKHGEELYTGTYKEGDPEGLRVSEIQQAEARGDVSALVSIARDSLFAIKDVVEKDTSRTAFDFGNVTVRRSEVSRPTSVSDLEAMRTSVSHSSSSSEARLLLGLLSRRSARSSSSTVTTESVDAHSESLEYVGTRYELATRGRRDETSVAIIDDFLLLQIEDLADALDGIRRLSDMDEPLPLGTAALIATARNTYLKLNNGGFDGPLYGSM